MATGTIKRLHSAKGFGFIRPDVGPPDVFFHRSAVRTGSFEQLQEGEKVDYTDEPGEKGPRAGNVRSLR